MIDRHFVAFAAIVWATSAFVESAHPQSPSGVPNVVGEVKLARLGMTGVHRILTRSDGSAVMIGAGRNVLALVDEHVRPGPVVASHGLGTIDGIPRAGLVQDMAWLSMPLATELLVVNRSGAVVRRVPSDRALVLPSGEDAPVVPPGGMMSPIALGLLPDDGLLLQVMSPPTYPVPDAWARMEGATSALVTTDSRGVIRGFMDWLPRDRRCIFGGSRLPFCSTQARAIAPDASRFASVLVAEHPVGDSLALHIVMKDTQGATLYTRRDHVIGVALDASSLDSAMGRIVNSRRAPLSTERRDSLLEHYRPTFVPPIEGAFIDVDGRLWLQVATDDSSRLYKVLGKSGEDDATLTFPPDVQILSAGGDRAWGISTSGGATTVVAFSI